MGNGQTTAARVAPECPTCHVPLNRLAGQDGWPTERVMASRRGGRIYRRRVLAVIYACPRCEFTQKGGQ